jgi:carbonic anhydrase
MTNEFHSHSALTPPATEFGRAPGSAPPGGSRPEPDNFQVAIERNRVFAEAGGHEGAVMFPRLRLMVITCLDPRVDPAAFLGLGLGDAMVVRNVGGRVTPEVINDVAFIGQLAESAVADGPLFDVAVIHHNECGAGALADDAFRRRYAHRIGVDASTQRSRAVIDPVATVTADAELLRNARSSSPRIAVSGHVYDVRTGLVDTVSPARRGPEAPHRQPVTPGGSGR